MEQPLRALAIYTVDPGLVPNTHMAAYNYLHSSSREPQILFWTPLTLHAEVCLYWCRQNTHKINMFQNHFKYYEDLIHNIY